MAEGQAFAAAGEIEPHSDLGPEHHSCAVEIHISQAVADIQGRSFCTDHSRGFHLIAGIGKVLGIMIEIQLRLCAVVQHFLNQGLGLVGVVIIQQILGIFPNGIGLAQNIAGAITDGQNDALCHLSSCQIYRKIVTVCACSHCRQGVRDSFHTANRNGGSGICSFCFHIEVHCQIIAQHQLLTDNFCFCSKHGHRHKACQHTQG